MKSGYFTKNCGISEINHLEQQRPNTPYIWSRRQFSTSNGFKHVLLPVKPIEGNY